MIKLIKAATLIVLCDLVFFQVNGQNALPPQIRIRQTLDGISDPGGVTRGEVLYGVEVEPGRILGDYYMDTKWNKGSLLLFGYEKVLDGYYIKYDIEGNALEVKVDELTKLIPINKVQSMIWYDSLTQVPRAFVNAKDYTEKGVQLSGLLEILEDGQIPLVKKTTIWIKEPDYVLAFDVGSKDTKIYKKENLYMLQGKELIEVKKKKELLAAFGKRSNEMEKYIKINKLNIKDERGLRVTFRHYNTLFENVDN